MHSLPPSLSTAFPVYVQPRDTFPPNPYLPCQPISPELAFAIFQSLPLPGCPVPVPPGVSMATGEGRKRLMASCNCARLRERKRRAGKQELAQQNPPAPRPRIALSSTGIMAGEWWGVSGAAPGRCCPRATALVPSRRRRKRRKGGSCGWQLPKAPANFLQLRRGEVEPWLRAAPRRGSVREAFVLSASSLRVLGTSLVSHVTKKLPRAVVGHRVLPSPV